MARFIPPREPLLEGRPDVMSRSWYLFFQGLMDPAGQSSFDEIELLATGSELGGRVGAPTDDAEMPLWFIPDDRQDDLADVPQFPDSEDILIAPPLDPDNEDQLVAVYIPDDGLDELAFAPAYIPDDYVFGYVAGQGGVVAQATSKSTAVTLDKPSGQITMHNAALAAAAVVTFTLNDSVIGATDMLVCVHQSAGTAGAYLITGQVTGAGTASITVTNISAGSLSEAIVLKFILIPAAIS